MFKFIKTFILLATISTALFIMVHLNGNMPDLQSILNGIQRNGTITFWAIDATSKDHAPDREPGKQYTVSFTSNPKLKDQFVYFKGFNIGRISDTFLTETGKIVCRIEIRRAFAELLKDGSYAEIKLGKLSILSPEEGAPLSTETMQGYLSRNEYHRQQLEMAAEKLSGNFTAIAGKLEECFNRVRGKFENGTLKEVIR